MTTQEILRQWREEKEWQKQNTPCISGDPITDRINSVVDNHNQVTFARQRLLAELVEMAMDDLRLGRSPELLLQHLEERLTEAAKGEKL